MDDEPTGADQRHETPPPPAAAGARPERPGHPLDDNLMLGGAGVVLIGSFLPFMEFDLDLGGSGDSLGFEAFFGAFIETSWTAWSNAWSIMPMVTLPVLAVLLGGVAAGLRRYSTTEVPDRIGGFPTAALLVFAGAAAACSVLAHLIRVFSTPGSGGDGDIVLGAGGWILVVGCAVFLTGAVRAATSSPVTPAPPAPPASTPAGLDPRIVTALSAALVAGASFLPVLGGGGFDGDVDDSISAWTEGFWPLFGLPVLLALAVAGIALSVPAAARGPVGLTARQWQLATASYAAFVAVALFIGNPAFGPFGSFLDPEIGLYLMVLGAAGLVAGSLMGGRRSE